MSGKLKYAGWKSGIVVSRFNHFITAQLLEGALATIKIHCDCEPEVMWVPGAFEIPIACKALALRSDIDAVIALGCVIQGDTPHFDYVCAAAAQGVTQAMLETMKPIAFGVLTTLTVDQAIQRAALTKDNKGGEAAEVALTMAGLLKAHQIQI